jgi:putative ABC transport system permease protein
VKFYHLIVANLLRRKIRTTLSILSFAVALILFYVLAMVQLVFEPGSLQGGVGRLLVLNRVSVILPLPVAYRQQMLHIPGVKGVTYATWFGGVYQDERNPFVQFAVGADSWRPLFPEYNIADDQWKAFVEDREGAFVGEQTAQRFHWKIGDRIPLKGTTYPGIWEFNIRGIYSGKTPDTDTTVFWLHWDLLNEQVEDKSHKNLVGWYTVGLDGPEDADRVIKAIDSQFANSAWETKSATENEAVSSYARSMGNIRPLVMGVGVVVFFTLLLVGGNTVAIAVRERYGEIAIMKAMGFTDRFMLTLVILESLTIALLGGATGVGLAQLLVMGLAKLVATYGDPTNGILQYFHLPTDVAIKAFAITLFVGFISGVIPAVSAMRLVVVDGLRRR